MRHDSYILDTGGAEVVLLTDDALFSFEPIYKQINVYTVMQEAVRCMLTF